MTYDITYSIVRLTMRFEKQILAIGSGFIYIRNSKYYLVTAWHNLSGRHSNTLEPLDRKNGGLPNNMIVDMPIKIPDRGGWSFARIPIRFRINDDNQAGYRVHAQKWPRVDVALIEFTPQHSFRAEVYLSNGETQEYDTTLLFDLDGQQSQQVALVDAPVSVPLPDNWEAVHTVGDPLFLLGFPAGICDHSVTPIWKRATIASEPSRDWDGQAQMLVDSASRKGMSGGAALYFDKKGVVPTQPGSSLTISRPLYIVHGVYVGRLGDSEFEAQVGVVWKKRVIDEAIDSGLEAISTFEIELPPSRVTEMVQLNMPTDVDPNVYLQEKPVLGYLTFKIMSELEGRANPYFVVEEIKRIAALRVAETT